MLQQLVVLLLLLLLSSSSSSSSSSFSSSSSSSSSSSLFADASVAADGRSTRQHHDAPAQLGPPQAPPVPPPLYAIRREPFPAPPAYPGVPTAAGHHPTHPPAASPFKRAFLETPPSSRGAVPPDGRPPPLPVPEAEDRLSPLAQATLQDEFEEDVDGGVHGQPTDFHGYRSADVDGMDDAEGDPFGWRPSEGATEARGRGVTVSRLPGLADSFYMQLDRLSSPTGALSDGDDYSMSAPGSPPYGGLRRHCAQSSPYFSPAPGGNAQPFAPQAAWRDDFPLLGAADGASPPRDDCDVWEGHPLPLGAGASPSPVTTIVTATEDEDNGGGGGGGGGDGADLYGDDGVGFRFQLTRFAHPQSAFTSRSDGFTAAFTASPPPDAVDPDHDLDPGAAFTTHRSTSGTCVTQAPPPPAALPADAAVSKRRKRVHRLLDEVAAAAAADDADFTGTASGAAPWVVPPVATGGGRRDVRVQWRNEDLLCGPPPAAVAVADVAGPGADAAQLTGAQVVGQVDDSFVVVRIGHVIAVVDQHAADERVKLEALGGGGGGACVHGHRAVNEVLEVTPQERWALQEQRATFVDDWGFQYSTDAPPPANLPPTAEAANNDGDGDGAAAPPPPCWVRLERVPVVYANKPPSSASSSSSSSSSSTSSNGEVLTSGDFLEFVRDVLAEPWQPRALRRPPCLRRIAASVACKSAIKFGDHLSRAQCQALLTDLSHTQLPFQCAHGRPSIQPLLEMFTYPR